MRGESSGVGWSPRGFSDKEDEGGGGVSRGWLGGVVERGQREGGWEGRGPASGWRGVSSPLARGRGEER